MFMATLVTAATPTLNMVRGAERASSKIKGGLEGGLEERDDEPLPSAECLHCVHVEHDPGGLLA